MVYSQAYVNFEILFSNLRTRTVRSTEIQFGNLKEYREQEVVEEESEWWVENTKKCTKDYVAAPLDEPKHFLHCVVTLKLF